MFHKRYSIEKKKEFDKIRNLFNILTDSSRRVPMATIEKCEQFLEKMDFKIKASKYLNKFDQNCCFNCKIFITDRKCCANSCLNDNTVISAQNSRRLSTITRCDYGSYEKAVIQPHIAANVWSGCGRTH